MKNTKVYHIVKKVGNRKVTATCTDKEINMYRRIKGVKIFDELPDELNLLRLNCLAKQ